MPQSKSSGRPSRSKASSARKASSTRKASPEATREQLQRFLARPRSQERKIGTPKQRFERKQILFEIVDDQHGRAVRTHMDHRA